MTAPYRLYGGQFSPFSQKVAGFMRFKGIAHAWIERAAAKTEEFNRYAKLPLLPLLVGADEAVLQDSTAILEVLSRRYPDPSTRHPEPAIGFLAALLEDFADEWVNKALQHYRWGDDGAASSAAAIAQLALGDSEAAYHAAGEAEILARMQARKPIIGLTPSAAEVIGASFQRTVRALSAIFTDRQFLFGDRPSTADFSLAAQLSQLNRIAAARDVFAAEGAGLLAWLARMEQPENQGEFLPPEQALAGLEPILQEIGQVYLPWLEANARAHAAGQAAFEVMLAGQALAQAPQRYAAKALAELRRKRGFLAQDAMLTEVLARMGAQAILGPLHGPGPQDSAAASDASPEEADADPDTAPAD